MKIQTCNEIDFLIAQHQDAIKNYKKYNDYVNRNTKETKDDHVIFANNCTIRNNYRELERSIRIQLKCYGVVYDGKNHYSIPVVYKDNNDKQEKNTDTNN